MSGSTKLHLEEIQINDLRCFSRETWKFPAGVSLIRGENGCGKTTLLEAICILAHGRSFRAARDPQLVRQGEKQFFIQGYWRRFGKLHAEARGHGSRVELRLQGSPVQRHLDLMEALPVIIEAPQARRLVDGTSRERRHWLDTLLISSRDGYGSSYRYYFRCLMQWQRLCRYGQFDVSEMVVRESQLVAAGLEIMKLRQIITGEINSYLSECTDLVEGELRISIRNSAPDDAEEWASILGKNRTGKRHAGFRLGPHCDKIQIIYREREILSSGSRGQQRMAAIALRMAEWEIRRRKRGVSPLILLDDCLEPLDRNRQGKLVNFLQSSGAQVLITTPQDVELDSTVHVQKIEQEGIRFPLQSAPVCR